MLKYSPVVGEVVECDLGKLRNPPLNPVFDGIILNEMRKRRPAVILNAKLPNGCCIIVPVSSKGDTSAVDRGYHVPLDASHLPESLFDRRSRWAIAECMTHVSKQRLFPYMENGRRVKIVLPSHIVAAIQRSMVRTLNGKSLLLPPVAQGVGP